MDQKKIGSFIAARRKDNSLTQSQLAEKLGITDNAVSKWENKSDTHNPTVLKLKNVKKVYETESTSTVAVKDVSLEITKGSFVGIMGASGSGKTTLLNMIATIDKATGGQIEIDGYNTADLSENELASFRREHLGFVFQEYNLLDTLTVYENIALALTIKQIPKESVKQTIVDLAGKLGISEILDKFPYEISGGQRHRSFSPEF